MPSTTFYPDPNPETASFDGRIGNDGGTHSWSDVKTETDADNFTFTLKDDTGTSISVNTRGGATTGQIHRGIILFDTSSIPDGDNISSSTLDLYVTGVTDNDTEDIGIVEATTASSTGLTGTDYGNIGSSEGATRLTLASLSTSAYNTFTLNATGLGFISKTGVSKFGVRGGADLDNTDHGNSTNQMLCSSADVSGTSQDPKLVVVTDAVVTVSDTVSMTDTQTTVIGKPATVTDSSTLTDTITTIRAAVITVTDTISLVETGTATEDWTGETKNTGTSWSFQTKN